MANSGWAARRHSSCSASRDRRGRDHQHSRTRTPPRLRWESHRPSLRDNAGMTRWRGRCEVRTWIALIAVAIGLPIAVIAGVLIFMNVTADARAPNAQDVPSASASPLPKWSCGRAGARPRSRGCRANRTCQDSRWQLALMASSSGPKGFGWANVEKPGACRARTALQDRARIHRAHLGRRRPAASNKAGCTSTTRFRRTSRVPRKQYPSRCAS
jgi:hypothetical protein